MRVATAAFAAFLVMLAPDTALASGGGSSGVHVDPGSPSQHQYVIPVNAARGETSSGNHSGGSSPHLFGNGIKPGSSSGSSSGGGSRGATARAKAKAKAHAAKPTRKGLHTPSYALASSGRPPSGPGSSGSGGDGGSGWVPLVAGGALVLLLGCGGGFALRRRILRA